MRRGFTTLELIVFLLTVGCLAAIAFAIFRREQNRVHSLTCQIKMKGLGEALISYSRDNDDKFPPNLNNANSSASWLIGLRPYANPVYGVDFPDCPQNHVLARSTFAATDYFYNVRLAQRSIPQLRTPSSTVAFGEGEPASADYACWDFSRCVGQTASGPVGAVPESARTRHLDGENIAFTDGHVKWFARERQQPKPHPALGFSFALK